MNKSYSLGIFAICFAAMLWAFEGIVLLPKLNNLDPGFVVLALHFIGFIILSFFLPKEFKKIWKLNLEDFIYFGLIALFGGALGTLAIVKALFLVNFQNLSVVLLLQKLQPVFAILLALLILKEKPKKGFYFWAGIAIIASYFLTFGLNKPNFSTNANTIIAVALSIIAAISFASGTVFGRKVAIKHNFKTITFYRYFFTTIIMLFYVLLLSKVPSIITNINWFILVLIPITTGLGSLFIYYYGLKKVKASIATICELMFPITAVILDFIVNKNFLSLIQWISVAVMLIAITKISIKK